MHSSFAFVKLVLILLSLFIDVNERPLSKLWNDFPIRVNKDKSELKFHLTTSTPSKCDDQKFYYWYSGKDLIITQGGYSGQLLHGKFEQKNENGNLLKRGQFIKGLKHGTWYEWNENGILKQKTEWKNGTQNGVNEVYNNEGHLIYKVHYRRGKLNGKAEWFRGDEIIDQCSYLNAVEIIRKRKWELWK